MIFVNIVSFYHDVSASRLLESAPETYTLLPLLCVCAAQVRGPKVPHFYGSSWTKTISNNLIMTTLLKNMSLKSDYYISV